jgi:hypothetical protein
MGHRSLEKRKPLRTGTCAKKPGGAFDFSRCNSHFVYIARMHAQALQFIAGRCSVRTDALRVAIRPLGGGLESAVARATLRRRAPGPLSMPRRFIIKELRGAQRREAAVYQELCDSRANLPLARLLAVDHTQDADYLYLEEVQPLSDWPWCGTDFAAAVCRVLGALHRITGSGTCAGQNWDYEAELAQSARETLQLARDSLDATGVRHWKRLGDLKRVVEARPQLRARILKGGTTLIHGDVHPGNVIVRCRATAERRIVLIDWARARPGSGLEDVASWLHSLGCWDFEARRRHDSLLGEYLKARGQSDTLTPELRMNYWLASASNGLAGAIRYHLAVLGDPAAGGQVRVNSRRALPEWERVIRRAAALLPPLAAIEDGDPLR